MDSKRPQTGAKRPARIGQPLGEFAKYVAGGHRLLFKRPIAVIFVLLLIAVAVIIWHTNRTQSSLVEAQALHSAEQLSNALTEFRTIYTSEVVERIRKQGITVTHDYEHRVGAIPLPATMSLMLGKKIGAHDTSTQTRLYSAYPFPWRRAEGGLTDDFAEDAWEFLTKKPDTPFYRIEELSGVPVLRYATADLMRFACVDCHNTHPESPKTDWKIGEVRGILEIIAPLGIPFAESRSSLIETALLMLLMTMGGLLVIGVVLGDLRRVATEAQDLANQTFETNRELKMEVTGRKRAETALRKAHDSLELEVAKRTSELRQEIVVRQNAEKKLRNAEKMQALGTLAGGIAHNFNNALVPIRALSEVLMRQFPQESPNNKRLSKITEGAKRAQDLVAQIMSFSRQDEGKLENIDPYELVQDSMVLLYSTAPATVKIIERFDKDVGKVLADKAQIESVILNLVSNAFDAMEGKQGKLEITLSQIELEKNDIGSDTGLEEGRYAKFQFTDTGAGMDEKCMKQIFNPFFTTKEVGNGTGLGLSSAYGIVSNHGGSIKVSSKLGVGTTFDVYLPINAT